jgi:hypothetical protein
VSYLLIPLGSESSRVCRSLSYLSPLYSAIFQPNCHTALGVTSRDKSREKKQHSFSALYITLITATDMKAVLFFIFVPVILINVCRKHTSWIALILLSVHKETDGKGGWLVAEERIENGP